MGTIIKDALGLSTASPLQLAVVVIGYMVLALFPFITVACFNVLARHHVTEELERISRGQRRG